MLARSQRKEDDPYVCRRCVQKASALRMQKGLEVLIMNQVRHLHRPGEKATVCGKAI